MKMVFKDMVIKNKMVETIDIGGTTFQVILQTLDEIGYNVFTKVLRSSDFGLPQARERIYIVAFRKDLKVSNFSFPEGNAEARVIADILEEIPIGSSYDINRNDIVLNKTFGEVVDPRKPKQIGKINKGGQGERIYSTLAAGITLSAYGGGAAAKTGAYLVNGRVRKLTPRECARLQGFPETFVIHPNPRFAYKQFGDSVSVPVLSAIFENILKEIQ
jgi:DNA (cytosine-5)-methyltransferase 1